MIKKFFRKVEGVLSMVTTIGFVTAMVSFAIGCAIWSVQWVLKLLGVM